MELLLIKSKVQEQPQRAAVPCKALYLCLPLFLVLTNVRRPKMLTVSNYQSRNRNRKTQQAEKEAEAKEEDEAEKKRRKKMCRNCSARKWLKFYLPRRLKLPATYSSPCCLPLLTFLPLYPLCHCSPSPLTPCTHFGHCLLPSKFAPFASFAFLLFCLIPVVVLLIAVVLYILPPP